MILDSTARVELKQPVIRISQTGDGVEVLTEGGAKASRQVCNPRLAAECAFEGRVQPAALASQTDRQPSSSYRKRGEGLGEDVTPLPTDIREWARGR